MQPVCERDSPPQAAYAEKHSARSMSPSGVPPAQFIHQMLQVGRQTRMIRTQVLLQPFTYGVADRSTGPMIDLFAAVGDSALHDGSVPCPLMRSRRTKSPTGKLFPLHADCPPLQLELNETRFHLIVLRQSPGGARAGAFDAGNRTGRIQINSSDLPGASEVPTALKLIAARSSRRDRNRNRRGRR